MRLYGGTSNPSSPAQDMFIPYSQALFAIHPSNMLCLLRLQQLGHLPASSAALLVLPTLAMHVKDRVSTEGLILLHTDFSLA